MTQTAIKRNWKTGPKQFARSFLKGQVAAMEGKTRRDCPYEDARGQACQHHAQAWLDGFDSVRRPR